MHLMQNRCIILLLHFDYFLAVLLHRIIALRNVFCFYKKERRICRGQSFICLGLVPHFELVFKKIRQTDVEVLQSLFCFRSKH